MGKAKRRGNGQGTVFRRGETWTAQLTRYEMGKRLTKTKGGFRTKKDAYEWCAMNASFTVTVSPTFAQVYHEWSEAHFPNISDKKCQSYKHVFDVSEALYDRKFSDIGVRHFQQVLTTQKNSYNVRKLMKSVYSMMSDYAIRAGYVSTNYAELIELPKQEKPNKRAFTAEEVKKVWSYYERTKELSAGACLIMLYTGMRYGEISTIRPENIHLDQGFLTGGIKTDAGKEGEILLLDIIKPVVAEILLPENRVSKLTTEGFRKRYNRFQEEAGIERHTVHECRHTTATLLAEAGVQPAVIAAIMRHTNYAQTMAYTHIRRDVKLENLEKIV